MFNLKKVVSTLVIAAILSVGALNANAGVIVNLTKSSTEKQCVDSKGGWDVSFDKGVIVNLTGVIVNLTGVIVNFTGVIVNYSGDTSSTCGHLPTGDIK